MGSSQKDQGSPEETHSKFSLPMYNVAFTDLTIYPESCPLPSTFFCDWEKLCICTFPMSTNVKANSGQEFTFSNTNWPLALTWNQYLFKELYTVRCNCRRFQIFFSFDRSKLSSMCSVNFTFTKTALECGRTSIRAKAGVLRFLGCPLIICKYINKGSWVKSTSRVKGI